MKKITFLFLFIIAFGCKTGQSDVFKPKKVYKSKDLVIIQISENAFQHISYKQTDEFGNVPCNGLIVRSNNETIVFDTPSNEKSSEILVKWIKEKLHCKVNAVIPTHFHDDCLGGLKVFEKNYIPSYAYYKTIELAKENNLPLPKNSFNETLMLKVGNEKVLIKHFGEGHTKDNIVGYFPSENILFGGCLIKTLNASKGYLGDANITEWSTTVEKVKAEYPNVKIVIPGHGDCGNQKLLDYTIDLFRSK